MAGVAAHGSAAGVRQPAADGRCRTRTLLWKRRRPTLPRGSGGALAPRDGLRGGLSDKQRWKATFAAYFLGAVSQGQLALLEQTTNDTAGVAYASPNSWVVKTSESLSYELRHKSNRSLGRLNDAQFENLPMLQVFKWTPVKILAFLLSNSKSLFAIHLQLREFMYERIDDEWDIYISLSAFQRSRVPLATAT